MNARYESMQTNVTRFKSKQLALNELRTFLIQRHLYSGRPLTQLGDMRPREVMANWLLCAAFNHEAGYERFSFTNNPEGGDGCILDVDDNIGMPTEHIIALSMGNETLDTSTRIRNAETQKQNKGGKANASGKALVVLLEGGDEQWWPTAIARELPENDFSDIWIICLQHFAEDRYRYAVSNLRLVEDSAPTWLIDIAGNSESWKVRKIQ
jgi:hypothetical protein